MKHFYGFARFTSVYFITIYYQYVKEPAQPASTKTAARCTKQ